MLRFLRKGATSLYVKIFLAIIVIVFVFWGIGNFAIERRNLVAKVNGIPITLNEFQEYYNFQVSRIKQTFGELSDKELSKLKVKNHVLEELIKIKLLEDQAKKLNIKITPVEIAYAISQIPSFQENGKFSPAKYQYILRELRITPEFFEKLIKSDLIYQRLKLLLTAPILVSDEEIRDFLKYDKQSLDILEVDFPIKACYSKIKYTEKDLKNYYLAHRDVYKEKAKVKIIYFFIPYKGKVKVTEKEIEDYYEKNIERFKKPFKVKLRKIFVPGVDINAFKKAESIRAKLKSLSDFSKFGAKQSEWFEESSLPEILRNILKSSHSKDIIGPIKVSSGYLILGVEKIQPERVLKLSEVKSEIKKFLEKEKLVERAREKANNIYAEVVKANGLSLWAKEKKIKLTETKWLTRRQLSERFNNFKLAQEIFNSPKGEYFPPVETFKGIYLIELKDKKPERTLPFKEVRERVKKDYLYDKGKEICENKAMKLINELKKEKKLNKSKLKKFRFKEFHIARYELPKKFPFYISQRLINAGKVGLIETPIWDEDTLKVFYIESIIPFNGTLNEKEISEATQALLKEKRETWLSKWYQHIRETAKIKVYPIFEKL